MSFRETSAIGIRGISELIPFLKVSSFEGRFVLTDKGTLSEFLQKSVGDVLLNGVGNQKLYGIEVKTEQENKHGNLFLELWSNRSFGRQTPGWMVTLQTDYLFYYFQKTRELYIAPFPDLWRWFWESVPPPFQRFRYAGQTKHAQLNNTWGLCVPIREIEKALGASFRKGTISDDGKFVPFKLILEDEPP